MKRKFTKDQIKLIRLYISDGRTLQYIKKQFAYIYISRQDIWNIKNFISYKDVD